MIQKIKKLILNREIIIFSILSFIIPFIIYLLTLERKLIGGDTSWFALQILEMSLMVPTGYPVFSMLEKLFTFLPIGDIALRLNLFSAVFGALTILFLFFCLGLSLTNHPLAFFLVPAIVLYVIIINPAIFKSVRAVPVSILY